VRSSQFIARGTSGLVLSIACATAAAAEIHGYVTVGTDYVFRGISQSNGNPTWQAGLDYAHAGGFFAGLFAAGIDYPDVPGVAHPGHLELDAYAGFGRPAGRDFAWDVLLTRYWFPDSEADDDAYEELGFNLHYRDAARLGFTASDDARANGSTSWTAELELRHPIGEHLQVSGTLGHYALESDYWRDYWYWDAGFSAIFGPVTIDLRWFDTTAGAETVAGPHLTDGRLVASASVGF